MSALSLAGCADRLGDESLTTALSGETRERCLIEPPTPVTTFAGGFTLDFASGPLWIFPGASDASGRSLGNVAARLTPADTACGYAFDYLAPPQGGELLRLLDPEPEELDPARGSLRLTPLSGFVTDWQGSEGAVVFYRKEFVRGFLDVQVVGVGVALVDDAGAVTRLSPNHYPEEPTLTWLEPQIWGRSALIGRDGWVYSYRCVHEGPFDDTCRVGRAKQQALADPGAWEYRGAFDWVSDPEQSAALIEGSGELSVAYNAHIGGYVFAFPPVLSSDVKGKTGASPSEVNTLTHPVFQGVPDGQFGVRDVAQHPSLARDGDREIWFSYSSSPDQSEADAKPSGVRLVSHRLEL
ncbi:MAG: hypothetical protein R3B89_06240 [Polyangiaceae bacterium]